MIMFSVNKKLLQMKLIYFLTFAGLCPLTSFGSTFAKQLGFSTSAVGFVYSVSIVLSIFARLIFGYVADKFQKHKSLLISFIFMCACSILLLALFPQTKIREVFFWSDENATKFTICFPDGMKTDTFLRDGKLCEMYCDGKSFSVLFEKNKGLNENSPSYSYVIDIDKSFKKLNNVCFTDHRESVNIFAIEEQKNENLSVCSMMACISESKSIIIEFSKPIFWIYFCVYAMYLITNFVICVFMDTVCFQILNKEGGRFGNQRMFASMGWGGAALISGILTDFFSKGEYSKNYLPACILSFIFLTATGILLIFFEMPSFEKTTNIDFKTLETVLWNRNSANFACWCFLIGVFSAVVWQYAFWIIEDISNNEELMWDKSLQGVMVVVNTILGDVPTYYFFDYMISKLGYIHCMTLTLLLNAVRLFAYSVLNRPIWALLISMLDGFTFGTSYATIASYANIISTSDSKTTIQAIFNSIFDGIGTSFGGLCFGFAYNWYGGAFSFRLCSFIALFSTFAHVLVHRYSKKNNF